MLIYYLTNSPSFFTIAAGIFLFGLTAARDGAQINALTSMASFFENAMYGVLYGYAPEVFPTPHRGTGDAFAAAASRVTGFFAPIIAVYSKVRAAQFFLAHVILFTAEPSFNSVC
jgi:hypothetical protein